MHHKIQPSHHWNQRAKGCVWSENTLSFYWGRSYIDVANLFSDWFVLRLWLARRRRFSHFGFTGFCFFIMLFSLLCTLQTRWGANHRVHRVCKKDFPQNSFQGAKWVTSFSGRFRFLGGFSFFFVTLCAYVTAHASNINPWSQHADADLFCRRCSFGWEKAAYIHTVYGREVFEFNLQPLKSDYL